MSINRDNQSLATAKEAILQKALGLACVLAILGGHVVAAQSLSDHLWTLQHSWNGDDATFWMREEAYRAAIDVALAKRDSPEVIRIWSDGTSPKSDPSRSTPHQAGCIWFPCFSPAKCH